MTSSSRRLSLLFPAGVVIGFLFIVPLCFMAYISVLERGPDGSVLWGHYTLDAYVQFLFEEDLSGELVLNTDYIRIFVRSLVLAATTTVCCFLLAFPTALWMAFQPPHRRALLLFLITVPFWTNLLVRNYSWILMLRTDGIVDRVAIGLGLSDRSLDLLYTPLATAIGLVYSFLPYMVLPIYVSIEKIDRRYIEAAFDLGARRIQALRRIILPLSLPGIVGGFILVFVPCLGSFVSPELLGGGKSMMIGSLIQQQFGQSRNWPFGAALAFVLLTSLLLVMWFYALTVKRRGDQK